MAELHDELTALAVAWPETPDLVEGVLARLPAEPHAARRRDRARPHRFGWRPALAYSLAVLVAAFAITMAASPDARSSVLEWLGLESVRVERREPVVPTPSPGRLGAGLGLGAPVTLDAARARAPYLALPADPALGAPDAVYAGTDSVALVYGARPGLPRAAATGAALLVQEFPGRIEPFIEKTLGMGARLERLRVRGAPAYFIAGAHGFAYETEAGSGRFEEQRLAGNTLLVERPDGLLIRIEGALARERAVAIAESIP